jgi:plastocyanin
MTRSSARIVSWVATLLAVPAFATALMAGPASAGGGCHEAATAAGGTRVTLSSACFGPTVLYANPGATITWTNQDPFDHTVTGLGWVWGTNGNLRPGRSFSYRFSAAGVYPYTCIIHPGMVGAVVVGRPSAPSNAGGAAVSSPPPRAAAAASAEAQAAGSGSTVWRTVAVVALAVLLALVGAQAVRVRGRRRIQPSGAS